MGSASIRRVSIESAIAASWPPNEWARFGVVLGVSGGADSIAMACAMQRLREKSSGSGEIMVAHFHHGLRSDADRDVEWLERFCCKSGLELIVGRGDVRRIANEQGDGVEAAARSARYEFLTETATQRGARYVVTGHTADDQIETVFFRILRGTGLRGLAGMRRSRVLLPGVTLMRPMLGARRADVIDYLNLIGQDWREDATNIDSRLMRNKIRNQLLPLIRSEHNERVDDALLRLAKHAASASTLLSEIAATLLDQYVEFELVKQDAHPSDDANRPKSAKSVCISLPRSPRQNDLVVAEVVRMAWRRAGWAEQAMTEVHWRWLVDLVLNRAILPRRTFPNEVTAARRGDDVILSRQCAPPSSPSNCGL